MGCIFKFRSYILLLFYFTIVVVLSGPDKNNLAVVSSMDFEAE